MVHQAARRQVYRQSAGQGYALLLPTGQLGGILIHQTLDVYRTRYLTDPLSALGRWQYMGPNAMFSLTVR